MKKGWYWPLIIVAFLLGDVVAMGITVVASTTDPSHHVIPDYYQKAVAHDKVMNAERKLLELGWSLTIARTEPTDTGVNVLLDLRDAKGQPVLGASGKASVFHQARAMRAHEVALEETGAGAYQLQVPVRKAGLWVLDVNIEHAEGSFTVRLRKDLM